MKQYSASILGGFLLFAVTTFAACEGSTSSPTQPLFDEFTPTWTTASWSGGAKGSPNDRRDEEATQWKGSICPAGSVTLSNHTEGSVLQIINNCTITVTYALCVTSGSLPQPQFGLDVCAPDPFDTPLSRLTSASFKNPAFSKVRDAWSAKADRRETSSSVKWRNR